MSVNGDGAVGEQEKWGGVVGTGYWVVGSG